MIPPFWLRPGLAHSICSLGRGKGPWDTRRHQQWSGLLLGKGNRVIAEHLLRPFKPGLVRIAADKSADLAPFIDEGVQQEIRPAEFHAFQHILMDGIVRQGPALRKGIDAFPRGI